MSHPSSGPGDTDTRDGELLADLFDTLLQEILEGNTPDLSRYLPDRPDLHDRIAKTWALACSVAGRREPSRPVLGGYEIVRELGHGGMGTVYLARHQALERLVAIKVLPHSLAMSPRAKQRFLEEARALARLRHDHVVHLHRIIDHAEMLAFEMEFVDGPSLQKVILELRQAARPQSIDALAQVLGLSPQQLGTRSTVEWFVRLGIRIARALAEVHRHGLIHRDVKPSNILLRVDGHPLLADFGLARVDDPEATQPAGFAGTPIYAAPERLRGGDAGIDPRADVYSLAVTLYEALSLSPPFAGSTTDEVLRRIDSGRLPALRRQAPHVSRDLETVLGKAMEVDRRHRYATADAFADDLERLLSLQPIQARPAGPFRRALQFARRQQRPLLAALAGALLVTGVVWPALAHAEARAAAAATAAHATQEARLQVLALESLQAVAQRAYAGSSSQPLRQPSVLAAQLRSLDQARQRYATALAADPGDRWARLEQDVVTAVLAIRGTEAAPGGDPAPPTAAVPPTLPEPCHRLLRAHGDDLELAACRRALCTAPPVDRYATGLLAFLLGDLVSSGVAWRGLDGELPGHPLLEACLALQSSCDGFPERAYPRLFHAARQLPGATALGLALAEAALAMGDLPLAEHWLAAVPDDRREPVVGHRLALLRADLAAARSDRDTAARAYRELARLDPTDPTPQLRLADLAAAGGDHETARRLLQSLLQRRPDLVPARLSMARDALLRRDLPTYLVQAREALAQEFTELPRAAANLQAQILELGGLGDLLPTAGAEPWTRAAPLGQTTTLPLSAWLPPARLSALRQALQLCQVVDRCAATAAHRDLGVIGTPLHATWLCALSLPTLSSQLPPRLQAVVLGVPPLLRNWITEPLGGLLMPFARTLGTPMHFVREGPLLVVDEPAQSVTFAIRQAFARDTDGDSLPDVCIAYPSAGGTFAQGFVEVRSLADQALLRRIDGDDPQRLFARGLAVLDDIDGDQCDDLLIGCPSIKAEPQAPGEVQLRSGRTGALLWRVEGPDASFGVDLARLADLDGDGQDDFVVGMPPLRLAATEKGRAFLCSGRTGQVLHELGAGRGGNWFGATVAAAGDLDGDHRPDVLVGGNFGGGAGLVIAFAGATGQPLLTFADDSTTSDYGAALCGLGDTDRDGVPDLAIAATGLSSRGRERGKVQILSGASGQVLHELFGDRAGDGFGMCLAAAQDWVRGSGLSLAIGARRGGPVDTGYVRVYAARTGQPQQTFSCGPGTVLFGYSLCPIGDLDDDGYPEMLVPALRRDLSGSLWRMTFPQTFPSRR